jgi:hypothetical protein
MELDYSINLLDPEPPRKMEFEPETPLPKKLLKLSKRIHARGQKFREESITWLEKQVAPKLPTWMLTIIKRTDSLLDRGYKKYNQFVSMPHFTKFIWAVVLLGMGVSGFCVSS